MANYSNNSFGISFSYPTDWGAPKFNPSVEDRENYAPNNLKPIGVILIRESEFERSCNEDICQYDYFLEVFPPSSAQQASEELQQRENVTILRSDLINQQEVIVYQGDSYYSADSALPRHAMFFAPHATFVLRTKTQTFQEDEDVIISDFEALLSSITAIEDATPIDFNDVPDQHPNRAAIRSITASGIVQGYSDWTYRPEISINRVEFLKIVLEAVFAAELKSFFFTDQCFPDVPIDAWFAQYVCFAQAQGIIAGYPDGSFRPGDSISFAEAAKIVVLVYGYTVGEDEVWFKPFVDELAARKAIPMSIFSFGKKITRGDMAELIYRLQEGITNLASVSYTDIAQGQFSPTQHVLYRRGNDLVLHEPLTHQEVVVFSSPELIDFDLSDDGLYVAYTLAETGFVENSDVHLLEIASGNTVRLTAKNQIASYNPVIFPDNSKVAYVRRDYNDATGLMSDGEIWMIDASGDINSSERLFVPEPIADLEIDGFCHTEEDVRVLEEDAKIGISQISPDGQVVEYWVKDLAPECSGFWNYPRWAYLDGRPFLTDSIMNELHYTTEGYDIPSFVYDSTYEVSRIDWLPDGHFVLSAFGGIAINAQHLSSFNNQLQQEWVIFDTFEDGLFGSNDSVSIALEDVHRRDDGTYLFGYQAGYYEDPEGFSPFVTKGIVQEISFGQDALFQRGTTDALPAFVPESENFEVLSRLDFISDELVIYLQQNTVEEYVLLLHHLPSGAIEKIAEFSEADAYDVSRRWF